MHIVVGMTGASGLKYGVRLLESITCETTVVMSEDARKLAMGETGLSPEAIEAKATSRFSNDDMFAAIASGSGEFDAMVIIPCSMSTLSKIACGIGDNLITRTASVALKRDDIEERFDLLLLYVLGRYHRLVSARAAATS